ncbi:NEDD8 ultimate buster 1 isoform X2 [Phycodurus eques]|uniref:NEDD8 ultimate buster 1 isoform X2 n=1 Tax=Phycodurus eques TaxID=693459 RepID=UPI002ACDCC1B|nr:NEDD8 ultimate buster 1 isoform X2 [Phycodurus eques]
MADRNVEAKLKKQLKRDKIQLWKVPYSDDEQQPGQAHMQELAERYGTLLRVPGSEVADALEVIRVRALKRGQRNQTFKESGVATLELLLPRDCKKGSKSKMSMETRLDVCAQELIDRIAEEVGLKSFKVILNGKTLNGGLRLDQQGVGNHSKMMILKAFDAASAPRDFESRERDVQRTRRGFRILSERDGSDDLQTAPFLEVADQKGNPLKIPHKEKKALILAMGLHEKGRALMKRKRHDDALCHLLQADLHFSECGSALLGVVDNHGVLQLDVVWCYQALEALSCLDDGRERLRLAEDCFLRCYGERQQRLLMIKGNTGQEDVLFLRLHLLQSLLAFVDGDDLQARRQLEQVESLYARLCPDADKMTQLMVLGFSEREARLALRACHGDVHEAALLVSNQREEREQLRQRERQKRKRTKASLAILAEAGYDSGEAAAALRQANGDLDKAFQILLDAGQTPPTSNGSLDQKVRQLLYLGFERSASEAALALTGGDVRSATELLMDNLGAVPSVATPPSEEEEPGTSSGSTDDSELVNEILEDIPRDKDDYLDLTLEEELQLLNTIKTHLARSLDQ